MLLKIIYQQVQESQRQDDPTDERKEEHTGVIESNSSGAYNEPGSVVRVQLWVNGIYISLQH